MRISQAGTILVVIVMVLVVAGVSRFVHTGAAEQEAAIALSATAESQPAVAGEAVAFQERDESRPEHGPADAQKPQIPRKQRAAAPPLRDLRLKDEKESAEELIDEALSKLTEVNFIESSFGDAVNYLKDHHKINIWIDHRALADAGIDPDQPVTLKLSGVRFESILNLMLDPFRLEWLIQDEVLKITTRDRAQDLAETESFDVLNLLDAGHTPDELIGAIVSCVEPESWFDAGGKGTIAYSGGVLICRQSQRVQSSIAMLLLDLDDLAEEQLDASGHGGSVATLKVYHTHEYPAEELARILGDLVAPDTWGVNGASVRAVKGALLVKQTPHVHREIENFLKQLLVPADVPAGIGSEPPAASRARGVDAAPLLRAARRVSHDRRR